MAREVAILALSGVYLRFGWPRQDSEGSALASRCFTVVGFLVVNAMLY